MLLASPMPLFTYESLNGCGKKGLGQNALISPPLSSCYSIWAWNWKSLWPFIHSTAFREQSHHNKSHGGVKSKKAVERLWGKGCRGILKIENRTFNLQTTNFRKKFPYLIGTACAMLLPLQLLLQLTCLGFGIGSWPVAIHSTAFIHQGAKPPPQQQQPRRRGSEEQAKWKGNGKAMGEGCVGELVCLWPHLPIAFGRICSSLLSVVVFVVRHFRLFAAGVGCCWAIAIAA
jgi:hypothetical protein